MMNDGGDEMGNLDRELKDILTNLAELSKEPDRREEYERRQRDEREAVISKLLVHADIPAAYRGKGFDDFMQTGANRAAFEACKRYAALWKDGRQTRGMALFGNVGVGKSHLAAAVLRELITEYQVAGVYANVLHAFERIRWSFDTQEQNPVKKLLSTPFLVLDDLGSQRPTAWTLEQVSHIIDYRLSENMAIFVTSNAVQWSGLARMLTLDLRGDPDSRSHLEVTVARIIDRLRDAVGDPIVIKGKSWRGRRDQ
jgi:DNA replication protein DnaC